MSHNENQSPNILNKLSTALRRGKMMDTVTMTPGKSRSKGRANTYHKTQRLTYKTRRLHTHLTMQGIFYLNCIPPHY